MTSNLASVFDAERVTDGLVSCFWQMSKLVAYSDDEDEGPPRVKETQSSHINGREVSLDDSKKDAIIPQADADQAEGIAPDNGQVSTSYKEPNLLRLLAPPPRLLAPDSEDSEWGLGIEKSTEGVDEGLSAKLANFHKLKEEQGTHFNQSLNRNRSFRNPHIYSKLVQWVDVEETGSAYADMIKGNDKANATWMSSNESREELKKQGGKDVIAALQRKRQEEADERKKKARSIDFIGSTSSPKATSQSDAKAVAEKAAKRIREEMASRGNRERDKDREKHRSSHHRH